MWIYSSHWRWQAFEEEDQEDGEAWAAMIPLLVVAQRLQIQEEAEEEDEEEDARFSVESQTTSELPKDFNCSIVVTVLWLSWPRFLSQSMAYIPDPRWCEG